VHVPSFVTPASRAFLCLVLLWAPTSLHTLGAAARCDDRAAATQATAAKAAARAGHYALAIETMRRADALLAPCTHDARSGAGTRARNSLQLAHNYVSIASAYENLHQPARARAFAQRAGRLLADIEDDKTFPERIRDEARRERQLAE